ncbi:receptor-type tyrosine-protein phosphatase c [Plakobranchus ocellatus]|uniref:Receptor-type tyrosine-protein phosphatase c n=1 Tax=Plakobranchus ocellatus TaxID=259542 RepID=A0AAV3YUS9_9GAST|nr:receptor-type tyrosine-protein phosphatase c [Plakobranchus ocellatus]
MITYVHYSGDLKLIGLRCIGCDKDILRPETNRLQRYASLNPFFIDGLRNKNAFLLLTTPFGSESIYEFWNLVDEYDIITIINLGSNIKHKAEISEEGVRGYNSRGKRKPKRSKIEYDTTFRAETVSLTEHDGIFVRVLRLEKGQTVHGGERKLTLRRIRHFSIPYENLLCSSDIRLVPKGRKATATGNVTDENSSSSSFDDNQHNIADNNRYPVSCDDLDNSDLVDGNENRFQSPGGNISAYRARTGPDQENMSKNHLTRDGCQEPAFSWTCQDAVQYVRADAVSFDISRGNCLSCEDEGQENGSKDITQSAAVENERKKYVCQYSRPKRCAIFPRSYYLGKRVKKRPRVKEAFTRVHKRCIRRTMTYNFSKVHRVGKFRSYISRHLLKNFSPRPKASSVLHAPLLTSVKKGFDDFHSEGQLVHPNCKNFDRTIFEHSQNRISEESDGLENHKLQSVSSSRSIGSERTCATVSSNCFAGEKPPSSDYLDTKVFRTLGDCAENESFEEKVAVAEEMKDSSLKDRNINASTEKIIEADKQRKQKRRHEARPTIPTGKILELLEVALDWQATPLRDWNMTNTKVSPAPKPRPLLIHAPEGSSAASLLCACALMCERAQEENVVDIYHLVKDLRRKLPKAIEHFGQYELLWDVLCNYVTEYQDNVQQSDRWLYRGAREKVIWCPDIMNESQARPPSGPRNRMRNMCVDLLDRSNNASQSMQ